MGQGVGLVLGGLDWVAQGLDWVLWGVGLDTVARVRLVTSGDLTGGWTGCYGAEVGQVLGQGLGIWDHAGAAGDGNTQPCIAPTLFPAILPHCPPSPLPSPCSDKCHLPHPGLHGHHT